MTTLASGYEPKDFESRLYAEWETSGVFAPQGNGPAYSILLPPPNVTGTLHMGHAFQHTLQDALIRYHRMRGYKTLWQMGTDHAGIATEMVVSRNLALAGNGETRDSLGRDAFIEKVWEWKQQSGDTIERQMRRLGASGDWSRRVFTMDEGASDAVIEAFVRLYEEKLIYRGQRLVNWDPVLKTAISDLEVVSEEENGFLWSIAYPLTGGASYEHVEHDADGSEILRETRHHLIVATTRPETMLGDTAVMVHPDDERYAHLIGKRVMLPLCDREIPIIADDYVDRAFGTGVVKVTPAHDFNDYAVGQRHKLPMINIFTPDAKIKSSVFDDFSSKNFAPRDHGDGLTTTLLSRSPLFGKSASELIPKKYYGLDRFDARKLIVSDLEAIALLIETKPHKLQVPRGDRTGQVIEPYLTDQWFVAMDQFAKRGLELAENGSLKFVPPNWINTYRHWMENIQDWCISRQLWWGHRIPAWYDDAGNIYVARDEAAAHAQAAAKSGGPGPTLRRDNDVLETWFSSGLWPISTMGWPNPESMRERGFADFVPSSVLVTGFDIIFFWVARMIMMTDHFVGQDSPQASDAQRVPFKDVYITGLVRDKDGQKMSKAKGNIIDPLDIIDGIGIEALIAKRTIGLMNPKMAASIEKGLRKDYPEGFAAHGADALRFTMTALAGPGRDIKFDMARCEGYKNFCNKLWNATRFALMNTADFSLLPPAGEGAPASLEAGADEGIAPQPVTDAEKWILARLAKVSTEAAEHFASYRFDLLSQALYEFAWNEVCDWFVELAKPALNGNDKAAADSTRHTLLYMLESLLRLLHPLIPFVTEELWRHVAPKLGIIGHSISLQPYPQASSFIDASYAAAEADIEWFKQVVSAVRSIRSTLGISPRQQVTLLAKGGSADDAARLAKFAAQLSFLLKLDAVETLTGDPPAAAPAVVGDLQLFVPLDGLVDLDAERVRLDKEIAKVSVEKDKSEAKLAKFGGNVPAPVVEQERQRLADWTSKLGALMEQRTRLG
jgi:valyl-tRNA synthetase